jgi:hypothetical protein
MPRRPVGQSRARCPQDPRAQRGLAAGGLAAGYLRIVIRRVTAIALPALSLALTRTVTLPECP